MDRRSWMEGLSVVVEGVIRYLIFFLMIFVR
jgi:hypothetical protein